ncbi:S-layer homology domain-containing protein [Lutispora saccharofermentans]|uniref:S-layer homology domain-containing protein n=1 Tax=Lutispora saccharofermentans TaxID=3024236 RepID=A0ABT1NBF0_9FIRM|nr:S-layer homology domain-containing protein [Lutispora saccharofermentans]MCQ1528575.1 S-layer homology domain-containing protein [Lutispora saccharofermentans]
MEMMKILKKTLAVLLVASMLTALIPLNVFAETAEKEYSISNGYLTYTINNKTGGFSIVTTGGHPQKKYDNNIPLLYKEDKTRSNGTSFTTARIDGKDYIFGQSYGMFGIASQLHEPVISEEGRLLTVRWDIKGYSVVQKVALSVDEKNDLTGNVGISYQIINNTSSSGNVGLRILLDTALDNNTDAPYIMTDAKPNPQITEKEYKGSELPQQIRLVDSLSSPTKMAYALLKGWNDGAVPDKVIAGHWANLANTRYSYTADAYCDFSNYSNQYRTPDSALVFYWSESNLAAGGSKNAELLYGVGNFSSDTASDRVGLDIAVDKVKLDKDKTGYENDGLFDVRINLDNSVDGANKLMAAMLTLTADPGLSIIGENHNIWTEIEKGETKTVTFKVQADKQNSITAKMLYASLTATEVTVDKDKTIEASASRDILLPAVTGNLPDIQMNSLKPGIVYTQGEKCVTISGKMKEFESLKGSDLWDMYLVHTTSGSEVRIKKTDMAFTDDTYTALSFKTREELSVGEYKMVFRLRDPQLEEGFGTDEITAGCRLTVSADEKYKQLSYGILAIVRYNNSNYKIITFAGEGEYKKFYRGMTTADRICHDFSEEDTSDYEILLIIRGYIIQMEKEDGGQKRIYYQASSADSPITINNMLAYESDTPLIIQEDGTNYSVSGDGKINVINSISVWKSEWSINVKKGTPYTLDEERYNPGKDPRIKDCKGLTLSFEGAASMVQSIGGLLIKMQYGVLSSELQRDEEKSTTYGVGFGGMVSIPIKDTKKKDKDDDDDALTKKNVFSKGKITAAINEIRYGEMAEVTDGKLEVYDTGFIGIDTKVEIALPQDILGSLIKNAPGIYALLEINTIDNIYKLDLGVKVKVLECQGVISFKEVTVKNSEKIIPNSLQFYIRDGLIIPIVPPLYMTGLGGGIDNLADTVGGDTVSGLPPITLLLFTRLKLMDTLIGDFDLALSLQEMGLNGSLAFRGDKRIVNLDAGVYARWVEPWHLKAYGSISVIDGLIKGGITITIAENYLYGYVCASICIPDSVPLVGGKEVAGVEAAVTNSYIGANFKIIGIKFGVIYYWSGSHSFGSAIDLTQGSKMMRSALTEDENTEGNYEALYGTNIHPLRSETVIPRFALMNTGHTITKNFDPKDQDALLFEIPYKGYAIPKPEDLGITSPSGQDITMIEDDGKGGGNFLVQDRAGDGKYIYITVTDKALIEKGDWTLTVKTDSIEITTYSVSGVDNLPELTETAYTRTGENSFDVDVNWTTDGQYDEDTTLDIYLTEDKDALEKIKTSSNGKDETLGISVAHAELKKYESGNHKVTLPDSFENGTYYVITTLSSKSCGISLAISDSPFEFVNTNLPQPVKSVKVDYGGDGNLLLEVEDADNIDYTDYLVNIVTADGAKLDNAYGQFKVGGDIILGKEANLSPGEAYYAEVKTLREGNNKYYYGADTVRSGPYTMPELQKPRLLSVTTNAGSQYLNDSSFTATYKFDRPVQMVLYKNSEPVIKGYEFRDTWTFDEELDDGEYIIDFCAYSETKDSATGADFAESVDNAQLGFTVDTQAPVLSLGQKNTESLEMDGEGHITSAFGTNVVFADSHGKYTVTGMTEVNAALTVNGKAVSIDKADGTFAYSGICDNKDTYAELTFKAVDKAGNTTSLLVYAVNQKYAYINSIELRANGKPITLDPEGVPTLDVKVGDTIALSIAGKTAGDEITIDNADIQWHIMYARELIQLDESNIKTLHTGKTAIRAKYISARLSGDIQVGPEGYAVINISQNDKSDLKAAIDAARASLAAGGRASEALRAWYKAIIDEAQAVYDDPNAGAEEISRAAAKLKLATKTFNEENNKGEDKDKDKGDGSSSGNSAPSMPGITTDKKPAQPNMASMNLTGTVDRSGVAYVTITEAQVKALIEAAKKDGKGQTADGIGAALNIGFGAEGKSMRIKLEEKALELLEKEGIKRFDVNTPLVSFSFDKEAIGEMKSQASGTVTIAADPITGLSNAAKALIGKRPVYDLSVSYQKDGKTVHVSDFKKGRIMLGIQYKPESDEQIGSLCGVYVDKNGRPHMLSDSGYDNGRLIFGRSSLSIYGVGYKAFGAAFTDTVNHWAKDDIDFVAGLGLISGKSAITFAPNTAITRGTFLMALGKLSGADVSTYKASSFTDVKSSDSAMPYIEWAFKNKIVQGIGGGKFDPGSYITREQMAVMMVNYAKATGCKLPASRQAVAFADGTKINLWAKDAVKAIQQAGIIIGKPNNLFDPAGEATRGEASAILRRFVELVID